MGEEREEEEGQEEVGLHSSIPSTSGGLVQVREEEGSGREEERDLERTEATLLLIFTNLNSNISLNVSKLDGVAPLVTYPLPLGKIHQFAILHFLSR